VDPKLGLRFVPFPTGAVWAITLAWDEFDPRRERIQKGELSREHDFDALTYLPLDCSPHEAFGYFTRAVVQSTTERIKWLVNRAQLFNQQQTEDAFKDVMDEAMAEVEDKGSRLFENSGGRRVPKSTGADFTSEPPKKDSKKKEKPVAA